jgi:hypothetical protein
MSPCPLLPVPVVTAVNTPTSAVDPYGEGGLR